MRPEKLRAIRGELLNIEEVCPSDPYFGPQATALLCMPKEKYAKERAPVWPGFRLPDFKAFAAAVQKLASLRQFGPSSAANAINSARSKWAGNSQKKNNVSYKVRSEAYKICRPPLGGCLMPPALREDIFTTIKGVS